MENINFILGYVEHNCSVRCYTFLKRYIKIFKVNNIKDFNKDDFNYIDEKACTEFLTFLNKYKVMLNL